MYQQHVNTSGRKLINIDFCNKNLCSMIVKFNCVYKNILGGGL